MDEDGDGSFEAALSDGISRVESETAEAIGVAAHVLSIYDLLGKGDHIIWEADPDATDDNADNEADEDRNV